MAKNFLIFMFLWHASSTLAATILCSSFFTSAEKRGATTDLIAYLASLLEQRIIGDKEMSLLAQGLQTGELVNPISETQAQVNSAALLHRGEIQEYFDETELDRHQLLTWATNYLQEAERVKPVRKRTQEHTRTTYYPMEFYPIPKGAFLKKYGDSNGYQVIEYNFEMMATKVTQRHWVDLMGANPSEFAEGEQGTSLLINGKNIKLQPDNPIEQVTWWSVITFANKLSEKSGLRPVYDMSGMTFEGSAANGTLKPTSGELVIKAPKGNIYLAKGYRLPTLDEQLYVRSNVGRSTSLYYFGNDPMELDQHAWYEDNSERRTHPVALLEPLRIDGNDFYDLHGNVWEWSHEESRWEENLRHMSGAGWNNKFTGCYWSNCAASHQDSSEADIGFRLVRTIK